MVPKQEELAGTLTEGLLSARIRSSLDRLERGKAYKNISTVCLIPCRDRVHIRVVGSWFNMMAPMNQKFFRFPLWGMEIGEAYQKGFEMVMNHPELSQWKYILTLESDNIPPPDGLLRLYEGMDEYDAIGGLYFTKGEGGQPMIYGDPGSQPLNFWPQKPRFDTLQRCNGLGMGFTLFKIKMFKDTRLKKPWFKTVQEFDPNKGAMAYTQDLWFFQQAGGLGYKFACDTRVKVGHYDEEADKVW